MVIACCLRTVYFLDDVIFLLKKLSQAYILIVLIVDKISWVNWILSSVFLLVFRRNVVAIFPITTEMSTPQ
jgi:hypothetical protein